MRSLVPMPARGEPRRGGPLRGDRSSAGPVRDERGAALVEFALALPVFVALLLGMFTGGIAYLHQEELTNAAREAARYGSVLPPDQCDSAGACGGLDWAQLVQQVAVERSDGTLVASQVCVALVSGPGSSPVAYDSSHTTAGGTSPCFDDGSSDTGFRVQVSLTRSDTLDAFFFSHALELTSHAIARYEVPVN
ncbi:MAG TPA: TadE/TadG family type IV pilus assembly protein [Acidimicrobiales bacterium]|nr:TadE/TadG family type IV pilus assembly protein [Acidimicrobiales bacterium]